MTHYALSKATRYALLARPSTLGDALRTSPNARSSSSTLQEYSKYRVYNRNGTRVVPSTCFEMLPITNMSTFVLGSTFTSTSLPSYALLCTYFKPNRLIALGVESPMNSSRHSQNRLCMNKRNETPHPLAEVGSPNFSITYIDRGASSSYMLEL